ncbi:DNA polymerase/3'-5' exonuclease PolX [uncultured Cocleimonas sp.]|uniref:DNA polymerase/3'-5' exonuclease PolX n=1 Tax=uncultured Cocleimonas sp. TaxID=1051587 RepID=UPI002634C91A|nr:DNA polymerase/3'-5' exonuclease PolX [uncultured Cocleimonas sp.]
MAVHNTEIASFFERIADLLEIEDENPFRIRAYRNAARTIRGSTVSMSYLLKQGKDLSTLPNIGKDLAEKIQLIVETGDLPLLGEIEARTPPTLSDLLKVQGLGPKRVRLLYKELDINTLEDLRRAIQSGKIYTVKGFGEKTVKALMERINSYSTEEKRTKWLLARDIARPLLEYIKQCEGVRKVMLAGSFRRCKETVGDLDILVTAKESKKVMECISHYDEISNVVSMGSTRSTVILDCGMQVDVRVIAPESYGAALVYFTGSKPHNIELRKLAQKLGYKINEYGVFKQDKHIGGKTEEELYKKLGLNYIEPELRENTGELAAARNGSLPQLISLKDIRGDLHCHTNATDGHCTLSEMASSAREKGYEYISINDHSKRLTVTHGLDEAQLLEQIRQIDKFNAKSDDIVILKSIEVDILEDGSLDLSDSVLKELDFTVCAVHYKFNLSQQKQTERILRAMDNPYFTILAHPTGRLINQREAYEIDMQKLMMAAKQRGIILELNAQPDRLDLNEIHCKTAKELGVKLVISTDAHSQNDFDYMLCGINQARRGWLEAENVVNTRSLKELRKLLKRK